MEDKDFIDLQKKKLDDLQELRMQTEEKARIALVIQKEFKPSLFKFLERIKNGADFPIVFERMEIIEDSCDFDLRSLMDNEIINLVAKQGFVYNEAHSSPDKLVFLEAPN